mgnify:CR=1 FL=1
MIDKEVAELRRRYRQDRSNITKIHGCYVNVHGELVSAFTLSMGLLPEGEQEKYLELLKKGISGRMGKTLSDLSFSTAQVADSDEHRLLMKLRETKLTDEETLRQFYQTVIDSLSIEGHYLILLAHESYDVPFKARDGAALEDGDTVFSYILCAVCPVKPSKPALSYCAEEKSFKLQSPGWTASAPELGFLFPAFDGRRPNIYDVLYYTKNAADNHAELIEGLFHVQPPMPAEEQRASFQSVLGALDKECDLKVVESVHNELCQRIEVHKETKDPDPLTVTKEDVKSVLADCGVSEEHLAAFSVEYDREFGEDAQLSPRNIITPKKFEVKTPDVVIQVAPDRKDLLETRLLGGVPYLLIRADDGVEVNGVSIQMPE